MGQLIDNVRKSFILKVTLGYCLLLVLMGFLIALPMYNRINSAADNTLKVISYQAVHTINSSLEINISNLRYYTDLLFFGLSNQREILNTANSSEEDKYRWYRDRLTSMLIYNVSSAHYFDTDNNHYFAYNDLNYELSPDAIMKINAYKETNTGGDVYPFLEIDKNGAYVLCLYRNIIDIYSLMPIGGVMLVFSFDDLQKQLDDHRSEYNSEYAILSEEGNVIISSGTDDNGQILSYMLDREIKNTITTVNGCRYAVSSAKTLVCDMEIIMITATDYLNILGINYNQVFVVFAVGLILAFGFSWYLTKYLNRPALEIEKHMNYAEQGCYEIIPITNNDNNELAHYKEVFNSMISSIKSYVERIQADEHVIAQSEVQLLQAQIKKHFLYNTLDSIRGLYQKKDYEGAEFLTKELGRFYSINLSDGKNMITIEDELACVASYINILNICYHGHINYTSEVDNSLLKYKTLKFVLQPLVENAVEHGICQLRGASLLSVRIYDQGEFIAYEVSDDGAGMDTEKITAILNPEPKQENFGLRSTIKRVSLFYSIDNPVRIESAKGAGTTITIIIKKKGSDEEDDDQYNHR